MSGYLYILFWLVSFLASTAGAICGIGGGVIIKPVLDMFGVLNVSTISFLSGCTVLAMSCYSVIRNNLSGESQVDAAVGTPLAIGAVIGGIAGKALFQALGSVFQNREMIGAVQAGCLLIITVGTMAYTLKKDKISTHQVRNMVPCVLIGLVLGFLSSFLGIGGGPMNLIVLFYLFSMPTKTAAENSLYIILFSQLSSLFSSLVTKTIPEFSLSLLGLMVAGGIVGGACGRIFNKNLDSRLVDKLFICLMAVIIGICGYNIYQFTP